MEKSTSRKKGNTNNGIPLAFQNITLISLLQSCLCFLGKSGESLRVGNGDFGKHLSVKIDVSLLKTVDKGRIIHTVELASC